MVKVLDASALIAYLEKEPGYEKVRDALSHAAEHGRNILMTTVNWGEAYYILVRDRGFEEAETIHTVINTFPIELVPVDLELAKQAAIFKATKKLPYADSFAAALSKLRKAELLTKGKEFRLVEDEINVLWM